MKNDKAATETYEKPKFYRDRSKKRRGEQLEHDHPQHQPYSREHKNWKHSVVVDGLGDDFESDE